MTGLLILTSLLQRRLEMPVRAAQEDSSEQTKSKKPPSPRARARARPHPKNSKIRKCLKPTACQQKAAPDPHSSFQECKLHFDAASKLVQHAPPSLCINHTTCLLHSKTDPHHNTFYTHQNKILTDNKHATAVLLGFYSILRYEH